MSTSPASRLSPSATGRAAAGGRPAPAAHALAAAPRPTTGGRPSPTTGGRAGAPRPAAPAPAPRPTAGGRPTAGAAVGTTAAAAPTTTTTRAGTRLPAAAVDDFPYKSLTSDITEITAQTIETGLAGTTVQVYTEYPLATLSLSIPGLKWNFKGVDNVAVITSRQAYWDINRLTDFFIEAVRVRANVKGSPSPYDYWQTNKFAIKQQYANDLNGQRDFIYKNAKEATLFKISLTSALLTYFKAHKVLDPSAGWGDRLLGAGLTSTVDVYHGIDPNTALTGPYDRMLKYLALGKYSGDPDTFDNFDVLTADFLKVTLPDQYDMVFTSPPFFDYEVYSNEATQSIAGRKTFDVWISDFYTPYLTKAYNALISGGRMCLYVSNSSQLSGFVEATHEIMNNVLGAKYEGVIAVANDYGFNKRNELINFPLWVWIRP